MVEPSRFTSVTVEKRGDLSPVEQSRPLEYGTNINPDQHQGMPSVVEQMPAPAMAMPIIKDENYVRVENILADGLFPLYQSMSLADQAVFKLKGEETTREIQELLAKPKVSVGKIIDLIRDWLKLIPGVNRFFIEQESKIKADRLVGGVDKAKLKS